MLYIRDNITYRVIDHETIILNLDNGCYYSLNEVAAKVWESIAKKKCLDDILASLNGQYEIPKKTIQRDLLSLVKDLEGEGLIKRIDSRCENDTKRDFTHG